MSGKRYTEEFKIEAIKQVTEKGYSVASVAKRLGVTTCSIHDWKRKYGDNSEAHNKSAESSAEMKRLQKELRRVTEERDILKKAAAYFAQHQK